GRQDQAPHRGQARADVAAQVDAAAVREPDVQQRDIRRGGFDAAGRLAHGGCLADHLEIGLGTDQIRDPPADDLVVVDQEHADHREPPSARPRDAALSGALHRTDVSPLADRMARAPPRAAARPARLRSPLRRPSSGMPTPSSCRRTVSRSPSALTSTMIRSAPEWRTALLSSSRVTPTTSSASAPVTAWSTGPVNRIAGGRGSEPDRSATTSSTRWRSELSS